MGSLLEDLCNGARVVRRGMHSMAADANYWLGAARRVYTEERRATADGLVSRGLARWVEISDSRDELGTHRLVPLILPAGDQA